MIRLTFDKHGYPMAGIRKVGAFHLWPITRMQYKQFLLDTGKAEEDWFKAGEPKINHENATQDNYESLFVTRILPQEALEYAQWMGEDYDIPSQEEWQALFKAVKRQTFRFRLSPYGLSPEANALKKSLLTFVRAPIKFSFLDDGLVEWVKGETQFLGRGAPRDTLFPNVWNPEKDTIRVIDVNERISYFGFRLIKRPPALLSQFPSFDEDEY
jgi:Sulfatase-modifying factor enzyme 1